jgi:hypothetical protein
LSVLVQVTLAASRRGMLLELYVGAALTLVSIDRVMRFVIARWGLTTRDASPS